MHRDLLAVAVWRGCGGSRRMDGRAGRYTYYDTYTYCGVQGGTYYGLMDAVGVLTMGGQIISRRAAQRSYYEMFYSLIGCYTYYGQIIFDALLRLSDTADVEATQQIVAVAQLSKYNIS